MNVLYKKIRSSTCYFPTLKKVTGHTNLDFITKMMLVPQNGFCFKEVSAIFVRYKEDFLINDADGPSVLRNIVYYRQGFTFDLHHLANLKSPQANFILEFSQAANLITKFSGLKNCKGILES